MDFRRLGLFSISALLVQMLLGVAANLWATIERANPWGHIGDVGLVATHGVLGVLLLIMGFVAFGRAFDGGSKLAKTGATAALIGLLGAVGCGIGFIDSGGSADYSFGMALGWAVAIGGNVCLVV